DRSVSQAQVDELFEHSTTSGALDLAAAGTDAARHDLRLQEDGTRGDDGVAVFDAPLDLDQLAVAETVHHTRLVHSFAGADEYELLLAHALHRRTRHRHGTQRRTSGNTRSGELVGSQLAFGIRQLGSR